VSSLVLIYTPWPPDDWNELDIEFLGKNHDRIQFNHMVNIPPADPATGHSQFPQLVTLDFDPSAEFHTYAIEWVPGEARFYIDDVLLHTATKEMARMVLPQNILLTIWASGAPGWAGAVDATTAPTSADYDWIRVYRYVAPRARAGFGGSSRSGCCRATAAPPRRRAPCGARSPGPGRDRSCRRRSTGRRGGRSTGR